MAVLGSGRASIGFPDPVGSILAEYRPKPTHLDPIHAQNLCFPLLFGFLFPPQIPTSAKLFFTFLANGGFFEFFDLFHELRLQKLVCFVSRRGPGAYERPVMFK